MKICFVCNEYPPAAHGGIGIATRTLARALVESGHQVRVVGVSSTDSNCPNIECDAGVKVWRLKKFHSRFGWIRERIELYRTIAKWTREGLIDLVELPDFQGWAAGWPKLRVPVVARMHGSSSYFAREMGKKPNSMGYLLERASLKRADFHCSCSGYTAGKSQDLYKLHKTAISVLHNPVEFSGIRADKQRSPHRVIFTGTLTPRKGIISLINSWPLVASEFPNAELEIFGKDGRSASGGSMKEYLIASLPASVRPSVHFLGHVDSVRLRSAFQTATLAVFPSYSEAFALAPMEAMAEGCPTIYTVRGSGPELIQDGESGLLVNPDDTQDIARAILKILKSPETAANLGRGGSERIAADFTLSTMLRRNIEFYSDCIRAFRPRAAMWKDATPSLSRS